MTQIPSCNSRLGSVLLLLSLLLLLVLIQQLQQQHTHPCTIKGPPAFMQPLAPAAAPSMPYSGNLGTAAWQEPGTTCSTAQASASASALQQTQLS